MKSLSVVIPALNEERFIGETLRRLDGAVQFLQAGHDCPVQVIVVDNDSADRTADVARGFGARVVLESSWPFWGPTVPRLSSAGTFPTRRSAWI